MSASTALDALTDVQWELCLSIRQQQKAALPQELVIASKDQIRHSSAE